MTACATNPFAATGPIWLVGCGNMGKAMLDGWLAAGIVAQSIVVINPSARVLPPGVVQARAPGTELPSPGIVVIAVKPARLADVAPGLEPHTRGALLLSVLAGVRLARLRAAFPGARVIRALPNTPVRIRAGVTLLASDAPASEDVGSANALMGALGTTHWVDEAEFDAATAVASSSPAWLFRVVAALAAAGEGAGLSAELARRLAREAVAGAGTYALADGRGLDELAREVASPGGMTQAGLDVLDRSSGLATLFDAAVRAAVARAAELARSADE